MGEYYKLKYPNVGVALWQENPTWAKGSDADLEMESFRLASQEEWQWVTDTQM